MKAMRAHNKEGVIGIPNKDGKYTKCKYEALVTECPFEAAIDGGRILELHIHENGATTCWYDEGWEMLPATEATAKALAILRYEYDGVNFFTTTKEGGQNHE